MPLVRASLGLLALLVVGVIGAFLLSAPGGQAAAPPGAARLPLATTTPTPPCCTTLTLTGFGSCPGTTYSFAGDLTNNCSIGQTAVITTAMQVAPAAGGPWTLYDSQVFGTIPVSPHLD